jgi:hypothetical protein
MLYAKRLDMGVPPALPTPPAGDGEAKQAAAEARELLAAARANATTKRNERAVLDAMDRAIVLLEKVTKS